MNKELHIFSLSLLPSNNNHENNIMHLMIDMKNKGVDAIKEVDIGEDIKVVEEVTDHNVLTVVIFPIDNMTVYITRHF